MCDNQICGCETKSKYVGVALPLSFYKKLRLVAAQDETTMSNFLRVALIEKIERDQGQRKRRVKS